ncbi:MAG: DNA gyrase subunit A, partial [Deltaproteobacteria bacterium CG_4_10_14_3_um_filter_60_8]
FWRKCYEIPQASRTARGKALVNLLELAEGEKVAAILAVRSFDVPAGQQANILMVTKRGVVKKTDLQEFRRPMRKGKIALNIREDDEILGAALTTGDNEVLLVTRDGMSIRFNEQDVRAMGRTATGVRGMNLAEGDVIVGVVVLYDTASILMVTENGFGKRTPVEEYRLIRRGGKGVIAIKASERNGRVVAVLQVVDEDEIMMITDGGKIIRTRMVDVRVIGRNTQGVKLFDLGDGEKVVGVDRVAEPEGDGELSDESDLSDLSDASDVSDQSDLSDPPDPSDQADED